MENEIGRRREKREREEEEEEEEEKFGSLTFNQKGFDLRSCFLSKRK